MKFISRVLWVILFVLFFGFALKNTQEASLRFFFNYEVRAPLVLLLLGFFVVGAVLGVLAMMPTLVRHRRDLSAHKKAVETMIKEQQAQQLARTQPPQPDSIITG